MQNTHISIPFAYLCHISLDLVETVLDRFCASFISHFLATVPAFKPPKEVRKQINEVNYSFTGAQLSKIGLALNRI